MSKGQRNGTKYRAAREIMLKQARINHVPCQLCHRPIDYTLPGTHKWGPTADHITPVAAGGDEDEGDPTKLRPAHKGCQASQGARIKNARTATKRANKPNKVAPKKPQTEPFSANTDVRSLPLVSVSTEGDGWGTPRYFTDVAADAPSLWPEVRGLLDDTGISLRPWQEEVARRALALDGERLRFRTVVVSTPRQSGKSWLIKAMAIARCAHPHLFGDEPQAVLHVAAKHIQAQRIHAMAWGWAGDQGLVIRKSVGQERIIWPDGGSWDALTMNTVYGASAGAIFLDEVHGVKPEDYREGLRPTQIERAMPQLWALSTAHPKSSALMSQLMADGINGVGRTMVADWGIRDGQDPMDPVTWEQASPFWSEQRREEMEMAAGEPVSFVSQWLNRWMGDSAWRWLPSSVTDRARALMPLSPPEEAVCSVTASWEASPDFEAGTRWAVGFAWPVGDRVVALVRRFGDLAAALEAVGDRRVHAHRATIEHITAAGRRRRLEPVSTAGHRAATEALADAVRGGALLVEGISDVEWAGVRTLPAEGGHVLSPRVSVADIAGIESLAWATLAVQQARTSDPFATLSA